MIEIIKIETAWSMTSTTMSSSSSLAFWRIIEVKFRIIYLYYFEYSFQFIQMTIVWPVTSTTKNAYWFG